MAIRPGDSHFTAFAIYLNINRMFLVRGQGGHDFSIPKLLARIFTPV
jgi:hypothetical protein